MVQTIPADKIVNMSPGVVAAAGNALDFSGLILTTNTRVPTGQVYEFSTAQAVADFFGGSSAEAELATIYFLGPDTKTATPAALYFAQYPLAAVAGYVRGGPGITLAQVNAIVSGTLTVTVDGVAKVSSALNLSSAGSLSAAAAAIQAAFTTPGFTVTYDSQSGAFVITSGTTGATSTIAVTTGANATALKLTAATGAVSSPGTPAAAPGTFMDALAAQTQNFVSFTTAFEPTADDGVAFAAWANGRDNRFVFVSWDTDTNNTAQAPAATVAARVLAAGYSGTVLIYSPVNGAKMGVFVQSVFASLEFTRLNGRTTLAFRKQSGLPADVTNENDYDRLMANGLNVYSGFATANNGFTFMYPGSITGKFEWADSFVNQVWLNNQLQLALMTLLTNANSIPFNRDGDAMVEAACLDPIEAALTFGAIRTGVEMDQQQRNAVNALAGQDIVSTLETRGWYLDPAVSTASSQVRAARGPVSPTLIYMDGQSVQSINFTSLEVI